MELEARDYLWCLELDFNIEAQLAAIRALLRQHLDANRTFNEEIARLEEHARTLTGIGNEWAAEEWNDRVHHSAYLGAAHSMAAVGMLAPLFETLFHGIFRCIGAQFFPTSFPGTGHLRWDVRRVADVESRLGRGGCKAECLPRLFRCMIRQMDIFF